MLPSATFTSTLSQQKAHLDVTINGEQGTKQTSLTQLHRRRSVIRCRGSRIAGSSRLAVEKHPARQKEHNGIPAQLYPSRAPSTHITSNRSGIQRSRTIKRKQQLPHPHAPAQDIWSHVPKTKQTTSIPRLAPLPFFPRRRSIDEDPLDTPSLSSRSSSSISTEYVTATTNHVHTEDDYIPALALYLTPTSSSASEDVHYIEMEQLLEEVGEMDSLLWEYFDEDNSPSAKSWQHSCPRSRDKVQDILATRSLLKRRSTRKTQLKYQEPHSDTQLEAVPWSKSKVSKWHSHVSQAVNTLKTNLEYEISLETMEFGVYSDVDDAALGLETLRKAMGSVST